MADLILESLKFSRNLDMDIDVTVIDALDLDKNRQVIGLRPGGSEPLFPRPVGLRSVQPGARGGARATGGGRGGVAHAGRAARGAGNRTLTAFLWIIRGVDFTAETARH